MHKILIFFRIYQRLHRIWPGSSVILDITSCVTLVCPLEALALVCDFISTYFVLHVSKK